jgi:hypothetical protein
MAWYSSRPTPSLWLRLSDGTVHVQYLSMTDQTGHMHGYAHINAYIHSMTFTESRVYEIIIYITLI